MSRRSERSSRPHERGSRDWPRLEKEPFLHSATSGPEQGSRSPQQNSFREGFAGRRGLGCDFLWVSSVYLRIVNVKLSRKVAEKGAYRFEIARCTTKSAACVPRAARHGEFVQARAAPSVPAVTSRRRGKRMCT